MRLLIPTLLSAALSFSSLETMAAPDLILHGGKVYTAVAGAPLQQAVAIENGKILAVGSDQDVMRLRQANTKVIDLGGKVLMPGLIDSHAHVIDGGHELGQVNLYSEMVSFDELEKRLREGMQNGKAWQGDVLTAVGFPSAFWSHIDEFEKRFNRGEWADKPIIFVGWDHHTGWANRAMLKRAGVDEKTVKALKGEAANTIGRHKDGRPNGFLAEAGLNGVMDHMPTITQAQLLDAGRNAVRYYHSLGITAWMDPIVNRAPGQPQSNESEGVLPVYKKLAENGELTVHVAGLMLAESKATPADLDTLAKVRERFLNVPNLTLPGIKVFADGVPEFPAQTAAMLQPYKNSKKSGELLIDPAHFGELVSAADARGWLVHVHAIGDRAVRESLNGIEQARKARNSGIPHSITHLQFVNPADFPRFKTLGVLASMQMFWAEADELTFDLVKPYISATAFNHQYPAHSLLQNGAVIAGASDWPVSTPDPWKAIYQAITRKGPKGVLNPGERVDRDTMFLAYTINAARVFRQEDNIGSLVPGKQADMIVVDRDVFNVSPESLRDTQVMKTFFGGKEVFSRDGAPAQGTAH